MTAPVDVSRFYLIRRKDTGEYFRQAKGPSWSRQGNWVKEANRAKPYGNGDAVRAALRQAQRGVYRGPAGTVQVPMEMELVVMRVVEEGVLEA